LLEILKGKNTTFRTNLKQFLSTGKSIFMSL